MIVCPSCATELPEGSRFCLSCAARLAAPSAAAADERKVVTTLFCDLVAFTAMSEAADPEDVDAVLRTYHAAARKVIESHGGAVEKFIGDAVVGVFGVPAAHEDDPERAVRAGLRIVQALEGATRPDGGPLEVRIGVNTGEALVRLDVTPGSGEGFLTGDAVNVAARLQAAAPAGGVVVGAATHSLSARAIVYQELPSVIAKGKSEPLVVWLAEAAHARTGAELGRDFSTAFVGRRDELAALQRLFRETVASSSSRFALVLGEPGIGKSRLVAELAAWLDGQPQLATWRQGRCLPYGEGVAFWALGEIVKAHAGVLDSDGPEVAEVKLEAVVPEGLDRAWLANRLRPLLGLETTQATREENFAAWEGFLEHLAGDGPAVLVFEDLHWADAAMLAFLEHLAGRTREVPLLLVATARPELLERHADFGAALPVERLTLRPLSDYDTGRLIADLLETNAAPAEIRAPILERCAGNPLYAEEYVRLLRERGFLLQTAEGVHVDQGVELPLPDSIQAVIAARLDTLKPEHKAVLADAAVIGGTFWSGAVAALSGREVAAVEHDLADLAATELIRVARASSMAGEREYVFWHVLARDVAYGELTRVARAGKHAAAAGWLEAKAGERVEDVADVLAHHYVTALDLATAAGQGDLAEALLDPAVRFLTLAGDRSLPLDVAAAERSYARALALCPREGLERSRLLVRWGNALRQLVRLREAAEALESGVEGLLAAGERREAAVALTRHNSILSLLGDPRCARDQREALALLEGDDPSPELVEVLVRQAGALAVDLDTRGAIDCAERALTMASGLGLPLPPEALSYRGASLGRLGDARGIDDLRLAVTEARAQGLGWTLGYCLQALCVESLFSEDPRAYGTHGQGYLEYSRRCGADECSLDAQILRMDALFWLGEWDLALQVAAEMRPMLAEAEDLWELVSLSTLQIQMLLARGQTAEAASIARWLTEAWSRGQATAQDAPFCLACGAAAAQQSGHGDAARGLLQELLGAAGVSGSYTLAQLLLPAMRTALACDDPDLAARLCEGFAAISPFHRHMLAAASALLAEAEGDLAAAVEAHRGAAEGWHDFGAPYEEGHALLGQGRCLVALGRAPEAAAPLAVAREMFARLGARPALTETHDWLAKATATD